MVGRIHRLYRTGNMLRQLVLVYVAVTLVYLAADFFKLAENTAPDNKMNRIITWHIQLAIKNDMNRISCENIAQRGFAYYPSCHAAQKATATKAKMSSES